MESQEKKRRGRRVRRTNLRVAIVGLGALGRRVALEAVTLGLKRLVLIDNGRVHTRTALLEGYAADDIGRPRLQATVEACHARDPTLEIRIMQRFKLRQLPEVDAVLWCGPGPTRGKLRALLKSNRPLMKAQTFADRVYVAAVDPRSLSADELRSVTLCAPWGLRSDQEITPGAAALAAGLMLIELLRLSGGDQRSRELHVHLAEGWLTVTGPA